MRAMPAQTAIVLVTVLALAGCRSGSSGWSWNRKKSSAALAKTADPQLPSATASPTVDYASSTYASTAGAPAATQPGASAFAAPAASGSLDGAPYPGATAGYNNPPGGANAYGTTAAGADPAAMAATPQQGAYTDGYGQPPAAAPAAGYPTTGTPDPYQAAPQTAANPYGGTAAANPYGGTAATNPYGAPAAANPYAGEAASGYDAMPPDHYGATAAAAPPANPYGAVPQAAATANPYASPAQTEQAAADHYGAQQSADPYSAPAPPSAAPADAMADAPPAGGYQPGNTGYAPGDTGYSPPGVPQYEMPAEPNVVAQRKDPYYRPGGTTDYIPETRTPTAVADRYSNPASAYSQANPYMSPDGSNSPAKGYTQ